MENHVLDQKSLINLVKYYPKRKKRAVKNAAFIKALSWHAKYPRPSWIDDDSHFSSEFLMIFELEMVFEPARQISILRSRSHQMTMHIFMQFIWAIRETGKLEL